jgi:2-polyprenyl-6-methoxyphenol hydroxylase-like FAD-dependent oxidoreductase
MDASPKTIIIIGAGIAGPTAALRLTNDGHKCMIFERNPEPTTMGGAVNIAPNGMRLLERLGVGDGIRKKGYAVEALEIMEERGGVIGQFENKSRDGVCGVRIMRSSLQEALLAKMKEKGVEVMFGKNLDSVEGNRKNGKVKATFKDSTVVEADLLIGADGIHSAVRHYVVGDGWKPNYTGQAVVYGMVRTDDLPRTDFSTMAPTAAVVAKRGVFFMAFADESRQMLYWAATKEKLIAEKPTDYDKIRSEEAERYKDLYNPGPDIIASTKEFFSWPGYGLPEIPQWSKGNVVLVGDAAHALRPNKGQGLSQAVQDVFVLARVIEKEAPLKRYEEIRRPLVAKLRNEVKGADMHVERGPWGQFVGVWLMRGVLKVRSVLNVFWDLNDFEYDPDTIDI